MTRYHNTDGVQIAFTPAEEAAYEADIEASKAAAPALRAAEAIAQRQAAYISESDPLFFQENAGEIPAGTHAEKRLEIKTRFPKD
tara:strand:+ start:321 stop:575 length:255 start_codon:yes stop_codon:yes gene_type:complete